MLRVSFTALGYPATPITLLAVPGTISLPATVSFEAPDQGQVEHIGELLRPD
jgi:hypothetical protein